jgi:hypothetical protein
MAAIDRLNTAMTAHRAVVILSFDDGTNLNGVPDNIQPQVKQLWQDCNTELKNLFGKSRNNFVFLVRDAAMTNVTEAMYINGAGSNLQQVLAAITAGTAPIAGTFRKDDKNHWKHSADLT